VKRVGLGLLMIMLDLLMAFSALSLKSEAFALSGTGVGIRLDGPLTASIGNRVEYNITVHNLGDYWVRNITVMDTFPNGTSSSWNLTDLAPVGQSGDAFNISGITYTIQLGDVIMGDSPYVTDHVEVTGYTIVQGLGLLVHAVTNFATFVIVRPVVGGYCVSFKNTGSSRSNDISVILLFIMTIGFSIYRPNKARVRLRRRHESN